MEPYIKTSMPSENLTMKSLLLLGLSLANKHVYRRDDEGARLSELCSHETHTENKFQWRVCDGDAYLSCGNAPWPKIIKIDCGEGQTCKDLTDPETPTLNNAGCVWKSDA